MRRYAPPCALADTSFDLGAGIAVVLGGSAASFRVLLDIADHPPKPERESDTSPAVRVTRKVLCALRRDDDKTVHNLTQLGPINIATRLLGPRKGERIHAIVSRRSADGLTLLGFTAAPTESQAYLEVFAAETKLHKQHRSDPTTATLTVTADQTPLKKQSAAIDASKVLATPEPWAKRARTGVPAA